MSTYRSKEEWLGFIGGLLMLKMAERIHDKTTFRGDTRQREERELEIKDVVDQVVNEALDKVRWPDEL